MKRKRSLIRLLLLILIVLSSSWLFPQSFLGNETRLADCWSIKVYVGKTQSYGDVSHDDKWEKLRAEAKLSGGISLSKMVNSYFSLKADMFFSRLRSKKGADNKAFPVEYYLAGEYVDFAIMPSIDMVDLLAINKANKKFSIFMDGQMRTITNDKLDNWVDGWKFDQLFVGSVGMQYHFNIARYVGPKLVKQTKRNKDYMKVIYGCKL